MPNRSLLLIILTLLASPIDSSHALTQANLEGIFDNAKRPTLADVQRGRWSCSQPGETRWAHEELSFKQVVGPNVSIDWLGDGYVIPLTKYGLKRVTREDHMIYTLELRIASTGDKMNGTERMWIIRDETHNSSTKQKWVTIRYCEPVDESDLKYISPFDASKFSHKGPKTVNPDGTVTIEWPTYNGTYLTYAPESLFLTPIYIETFHVYLTKTEQQALYNNTPRVAAGYICRSLGLSDLPYNITESDKKSVITSSEEKYLSTLAFGTTRQTKDSMAGTISVREAGQSRYAISSIRCAPRN